MSWITVFENWVGDMLSYIRCDNCGRTGRNHTMNSYWLYNPYANFYCNRCGRPQGEGRLYKVGYAGFMTPANDEAFEFEIKRAGKKGALFGRVI